MIQIQVVVGQNIKHNRWDPKLCLFPLFFLLIKTIKRKHKHTPTITSISWTGHIRRGHTHE